MFPGPDELGMGVLRDMPVLIFYGDIDRDGAAHRFDIIYKFKKLLTYNFKFLSADYADFRRY